MSSSLYLAGPYESATDHDQHAAQQQLQPQQQQSPAPPPPPQHLPPGHLPDPLPTPPPSQQQQLQLFQQVRPQPTQHYPIHSVYLQQPAYYGSLDYIRMAASVGYSAMATATTMPATPDSARVERPPSPFEGTTENRTYRLKVCQEPIRARMCGFGDKDRRPITPPPCVLLEVLDAATGQAMDVSEIDPSYYVVTVDLWSADGRQEVNLVRHSATSPSISATTASSYPPQPLPMAHFPYGAPVAHSGMPYPPQQYYSGQPPPEGYSQQHPPPHYGYTDGRYPYGAAGPLTPTSQYGANGQGPLISPTAPVMITQDPRSAPTGMFTRNLIGSLCVSAFKLADTRSQLGIWFILQDLSVRTEGTFRLKFSFVNVGSNTNPTQLNMASAPVLATCFSHPFQVFSAKKFPGVIESTALSKCFATQGIKIPIRKDANGRGGDDDD